MVDGHSNIGRSPVSQKGQSDGWEHVARLKSSQKEKRKRKNKLTWPSKSLLLLPSLIPSHIVGCINVWHLFLLFILMCVCVWPQRLCLHFGRRSSPIASLFILPQSPLDISCFCCSPRRSTATLLHFCPVEPIMTLIMLEIFLLMFLVRVEFCLFVFFSSLIFFRVPDFILSGSSPAKINNLTNLWWRWLVWRFSLHSWSHRNKKWREPNESRRILFVSSSSACLHSSLSCVNLFHGKNLSPPPANESGAHFRWH